MEIKFKQQAWAINTKKKWPWHLTLRFEAAVLGSARRPVVRGFLQRQGADHSLTEKLSSTDLLFLLLFLRYRLWHVLGPQFDSLGKYSKCKKDKIDLGIRFPLVLNLYGAWRLQDKKSYKKPYILLHFCDDLAKCFRSASCSTTSLWRFRT